MIYNNKNTQFTKMKEDIKKPILVPTDLTSAAECAVDHAIEIAARLFHHRVILLHVLQKRQRSNEDIKLKLEQISSKLNEDTGVEVSYIITEGSIFSTISELAEDLNAELIIMGIHGKKGLQHLTGSHAYRVITSSKAPVMVVKKKHNHRGYDNIVLPIDFSHESTQKVNEAVKYARYFNATIHIIGFLDTKSSVLKIKKEVIVRSVADYIKQADVNAVAEIIVKPKAAAHNAVLSYAEKINADMIMIIAEANDRFAGIFSSNSAEEIVDNSDCPVLSVIPDSMKDDIDYFDKSIKNIFRPFIDPLGLIRKDR